MADGYMYLYNLKQKSALQFIFNYAIQLNIICIKYNAIYELDIGRISRKYTLGPNWTLGPNLSIGEGNVW